MNETVFFKILIHPLLQLFILFVYIGVYLVVEWSRYGISRQYCDMYQYYIQFSFIFFLLLIWMILFFLDCFILLYMFIKKKKFIHICDKLGFRFELWFGSIIVLIYVIVIIFIPTNNETYLILFSI